MTRANSTKIEKPCKPSDDFPLWPHPNGQWCKKINGQRHFFGVWDDWKTAEKNYKAQRKNLEAGVVERDESAETVLRVIERYLTRLEDRCTEGECSDRHFLDVNKTAATILTVFDRNRLVEDLDGNDFSQLRKQFNKKLDGTKASPSTVQGHIRRTVSIFRYSLIQGKISKVVFGKDLFEFTEKDKVRQEAKSATKLLDAKSIQKLLDGANYRMKAMILLGLNCALGNTDIGKLEFTDLNLVDGWLESERNKTAVRRCSWLWPETIAALTVVEQRRFEPKKDDHAKRVFITRHGQAFDSQWVVSSEFTKLAEGVGVKLPPNSGFYILRHTCRSIAEESGDESAKRWIMGHKRTGISDRYAHIAPKDRIKVVCEIVRNWLFPAPAKKVKRGAK